MAEKEKHGSLGVYIPIIVAVITVIGGIWAAYITYQGNLDSIRLQNELNLTNTAIVKTDTAIELTQIAQRATATFTAIPSETPTNTVQASPSTTPNDTATHTATTVPSDTPTNTTEPPSETTPRGLPSQAVAPSPPVEIAPDNTLVVRAYPCEAQIIFNSNNLLRVVRGGPSSRSSYRDLIQQGSPIMILEKIQETRTTFWYRIADVNSNELGWISPEHVILSDSCPVD
jgi:hypothetical protein